MIRLVEERRAELAKLCVKYHVKRLELFGSATGPGFTDDSDLDFLVEYEPLQEGQYCSQLLWAIG